MVEQELKKNALLEEERKNRSCEIEKNHQYSS